LHRFENNRELLIRQIAEGQQLIERSRQLLNQFDDALSQVASTLSPTRQATALPNKSATARNARRVLNVSV
jgi:hypothetical protein